MQLKNPTLYDLSEDQRTLRFAVAVCPTCDQVNFPADLHGCLNCGAPGDLLQRRWLAGDGVLRNFVTVHKALRPNQGAPAVVAEIELTGGLMVDAIVDAIETPLRTGMRMQAVPVQEKQGDTTLLACHFIVQETHP